MSETSLISFSEYNLSNSDLLAAQQDSLRSLLSTQTGFTIENMQDNSEIASNLDLSTDLDSTESTPHKILFNSMDDDAEDSYSRKRRASDRDDLPSDRDASSNGSSVLAMIEEVINFLPNTEAKLMSGFNTSPIIENNNQIYFEDIRSDFIPQNFSHHHQQQQLHCELNNIQQQHLPAQYLILQRLDSFDSVQVHLNDDDNENDSVMDEENEGEQHIPRPEDPEPKLGIYNEVTRAIRLEKYREKRQKLRCDEVKYTRRQQVSINRPRSKGRFVKRQSVSETSSEVPIKLPAERKVEFEEIPGETSSKRKERRSAWEMLKNLFLQPSSPRNEKRVDKRFSLPPTPTFSEKLFLKRRKSTTAASTVSGRAKRKNSVDEFLAEEALEEPIRKRRWMEPVLAEDGHTYERTAITRWFGTGNTRSPVTNEELEGKRLLPNHVLKKLVHQHKAALGERLLEACENSDDATVLDLVEKGAEINARNQTGDTPLLIVIAKGRLSLAKELIRLGADASVTNDKGESAEAAARRRRLDETLIQFLEEANKTSSLKRVSEAESRNREREEYRRQQEQRRGDNHEASSRSAGSVVPLVQGIGFFPSLFGLQFQGSLISGNSHAAQLLIPPQAGIHLSFFQRLMNWARVNIAGDPDLTPGHEDYFQQQMLSRALLTVGSLVLLCLLLL